MKKERKELPLHILELNKGQLDWLPTNPRTWTQSDIDRTAESIKEDPDFLEDRPLLVVPDHAEGRFIVFAGNLRHEGAVAAKRGTVPCVVYYPHGDAEQATVVRRAMKDNGSFGSWDWDELGNNWDDLPLQDWGVPVWENDAQKAMRNGGLSTEGREGGEGYDEFTGKFNEELPLTTDDCYTPPEVYDLVTKFVDKHLAPLKGRKIVRPFYPGGNYEDLKQYPAGSIVIDNPPFSLYSKIVRFYLANGIDFFLFGPQLSLFISDADCCFCCFCCPITYENGAKVSTGFVTNLRKDLRIWVEHSLRDAILKAQKQEPTMPVYEYPDEVISSALLNKIANCGDLEIAADECQYIHNLDGMKAIDRGLFGGGFLLARAAAEKARAVKIELSTREKEIVDSLAKSAKIND